MLRTSNIVIPLFCRGAASVTDFVMMPPTPVLAKRSKPSAVRPISVEATTMGFLKYTPQNLVFNLLLNDLTSVFYLCGRRHN